MFDHHWFAGEFSPFAFVFPFFGMIWFWLLVYGVYHVARFLTRASHRPAPIVAKPSALEILRERYARGEIDAETFEDMAGRLIRSEHQELFL
jgi:putative membrane protein